MSKWIAAFSLFIVFMIAQDYQDFPWSQILLSQCEKFKDVFVDSQTTKK